MWKLKNSISLITEDIKQKVFAAIPTIMAQRSSHNIIDPTSVSSVIRKPNLPVCSSIPTGSLELGTLISIYGTIKSNGRAFRIDFFQLKCEHIHGKSTVRNDDGNDTVAFHLNPRIGGGEGGRNVVVMNSFCNGQWGEEVRNYEEFPFVPDVPFRLMILVEEDFFKIAVDGKHLYEFKHRCDFRDIARIHIEGDMLLDLVEFRKELRYLPRSLSTSSTSTTTSSSSSDGNVALHGDSAAHRQSRSVASPTVPYLEHEPGLSRPCDIYIAGMLPNHIKENFVINLVNKTPEQQEIKNIPLHISIRADVNAIVRNTMTEGFWGEEELYLEGPYQLIPGTHFDLMINNQKDKAIVAINGQPSFEYKHRHDPNTINLLQITGGVVLTSVRYEFRE